MMHPINPSDCSFLKPKIIDSWNLCTHSNTECIMMYRVRIAKADIVLSYQRKKIMDLYTLIGVGVFKKGEGYEYKAVNYEEGVASCRFVSEYYGVVIPEELRKESEDLVINDLKNRFSALKISSD